MYATTTVQEKNIKLTAQLGCAHACLSLHEATLIMDYRTLLKITKRKNIAVLDTVKREAEFYFTDPVGGGSIVNELLQLFHSCYLYH